MTLNFTTVLLFIALCGSWFLLARSIWRLLFVGVRRQWLDTAEVAIALAAACCIVVDMLDGTRTRFFGTQLALANLSCILFVISFRWLLTKLLSKTANTSTSKSITATCSLAILAIAMGAWAFSRLQNRSSNFELFGVGDAAPGLVVSENDFHGLSDSGRKIDLFNFSVNSQLFIDYSKDFGVRFPSFNSALIHRKDADSSSNCHGWVFTGGRFLLRAEGVQQILQDNGYSVTTTPSAGDIIVYRSASDAILHTGLVQGILNEGTIIIESKWGTDQRFLHRPEDQPYSTSFTYYHSDRSGHLIGIQQSVIHDVEDD